MKKPRDLVKLQRWCIRRRKEGVSISNKRIRWIMVEAAEHASRHDPRLSAFYLRILKRRGYQRAIVAVARRMLVAMYHVLPTTRSTMA